MTKETVPLPHSKESEMMVLGCMLTSENSFSISSEKLDIQDFHYPEHQTIYSALKKAYNSGKPADIHLLAEELKRQAKLESVGGVQYITTLAQYAGTSAFVEEYINLLKEKTILRNLISLGNKIIKQSLEDPKDIPSLLSQCQTDFHRLSQSRQSNIEDQLKAEKEETTESFIISHKETFSKGLLLSGFKSMDKRLFFAPGNLVVIQGMSSHGKSKWKNQLLYNFLTCEINKKKNPICVFIAYENGPLMAKNNFLNLIAKSQKEGNKFISYNFNYFENGETQTPFLYPNSEEDFKRASNLYEDFKRNQSLIFMDRMYFEDLKHVVNALKFNHPDRPICLFLDYFQIILNRFKSDGWERMKELAYGLEAFAQEHKVLIVAGSQVNQNRETREGKDIYSASTIVIDIFNHSVPTLKMSDTLSKKYRDPIDGKSVISITVCKNKNLFQFDLEEKFLFDGDVFSEYKKPETYFNTPDQKNKKPGIRTA